MTQKWQYRQKVLKYDLTEPGQRTNTEWLNGVGWQGWELVSVVHVRGISGSKPEQDKDHFLYTFKLPTA